jgi:PGF-CTERM protein
MAKRRKEEGEQQEPLDFQIPKFDEGAFIKRERRNIKTLFISFLFGLLLAVICFGFWVLLVGSFLQWELVLLVGVVNMVWLRYIFLKLNIDLSDFGRRGWLSSYAMYFFTWLLLVLILVNPPFYDGEAPHVDLAVLPGVQEPGGTIFFAAHIVDNVGVNAQGIRLGIIDPNGTMTTPSFTFENGILRYTFQNPTDTTGTYQYTLAATDVNGHKTVVNGSFAYRSDALEIISSQRTGIASGDVITIKADEQISKENFRVYYRIDNGPQLNVSRKDAASKDKYDTSAEYQRWTPDSVQTVHVYAEALHYFANNPERFSNTVEDTTPYDFTTANDSNIGTETPLVEWNITLYLLHKSQLPNTVNYQVPYAYSMGATPGFEVVVALVAVVVTLVLVKRKKTYKKT